MEVHSSAMVEGEISDVVGKAVAMEDTDYASAVLRPNQRVAEETEPELSSDGELRLNFAPQGTLKRRRKSTDDGAKQSSNKNQNTNRSQKHNQAKGRVELGSVPQADSEAQSLGIEITSKSGGRYGGGRDIGERFRVTKK
jgi:hypothetical protein